MKVSVPAVAPPTPPLTGASSVSTPAAPPASWAFFALSTSIVEQSMTSAPLGAAGRKSDQLARTCLPAGSMVTTTSAGGDSLARARGDADACRSGRRLCRLDEIEALDRMAGLDQIGGHRRAHVAKAEKGDFRHMSSRARSADAVQL